MGFFEAYVTKAVLIFCLSHSTLQVGKRSNKNHTSSWRESSDNYTAFSPDMFPIKKKTQSSHCSQLLRLSIERKTSSEGIRHIMHRGVNRPGKRLADGDGFQDDSSTPVSKLHNKPELQHCK